MTVTQMTPGLLHALQEPLAEVATHTIHAVMTQVPAYKEEFDGPLGVTIAQAVQMALSGFLRLAAAGRVGEAGPQSPTLEGAYALGRGEARSGRSADALLSAYRVGARVAWHELSQIAVERGAGAGQLATFAELVFAYIDELSAASVAGHADEMESSGRVRQAQLDQLAVALLRGDSADALTQAAAVAEWMPPPNLTAVLLPEAQVRPVIGLLASPALRAPAGVSGLPEGTAVLMVGGFTGATRARLLKLLTGRSAVAGPTRPWLEVRGSYVRALRALPMLVEESIDTEARLAELILSADPEALRDLRERVLAPLARLRPATRDKLTETLRSWLLHQGRRDDIAAALFVHPQTVRYRMSQVREAYGDRLEDPEMIRELTLALA